MNKRVLVVAAHPDDEVLGAGATIARWAKSKEITVAILGKGVFGARDKLVRAVLELDPYALVKCEGLRDQWLDTKALSGIAGVVEGWVDEVKPDLILTHSASDLNLDHRIVHEAVLVATRPAVCSVSEVWAFEVPSATEWGFKLTPAFEPNIFVDVTETLEKKFFALSIYEHRSFPHPRSPQAILALARYRGATVGMEAAEAFELIWRKVPR